MSLRTRPFLTIGFAVLLGCVSAVFIRSLKPPDSPSGSLAFLSAAKALPVVDRQGKVTDLTRQKGRLMVIHFWATWCPPCVEEIPALSHFWDRYRNRPNIALFAVSVDKDWKVVEEFNRKNPNQLPIFRDPDSSTAQRFGTTQYPETYITNKAGRVLYRVQGAIDWNDAEVQKRIEQLLSGG